MSKSFFFLGFPLVPHIWYQLYFHNGSDQHKDKSKCCICHHLIKSFKENKDGLRSFLIFLRFQVTPRKLLNTITVSFVFIDGFFRLLFSLF